MRIKPLEDAEATGLAKKLFASSVERFGRVLRPFRAYGYRPQILEAFLSLNEALTNSDKVEAKLKSLVCVRAAEMIGCPF